MVEDCEVLRLYFGFGLVIPDLALVCILCELVGGDDILS